IATLHANHTRGDRRMNSSPPDKEGPEGKSGEHAQTNDEISRAKGLKPGVIGNQPGAEAVRRVPPPVSMRRRSQSAPACRSCPPRSTGPGHSRVRPKQKARYAVLASPPELDEPESFEELDELDELDSEDELDDSELFSFFAP